MMNLYKFLLLFSSVLAAAPPSLGDIHKESKKFWVDQFHPWEKNGITKEMIEGAKELYFSQLFAYGMVNKDFKRDEAFSKDELQM